MKLVVVLAMVVIGHGATDGVAGEKKTKVVMMVVAKVALMVLLVVVVALARVIMVVLVLWYGGANDVPRGNGHDLGHAIEETQIKEKGEINGEEKSHGEVRRAVPIRL